MSKTRNQKLKLLYLKDIFEKYTDEENKLTVKQIMDKLESYNVTCERKTVYGDIECLIQYGLDIISEKSDSNYYYLGEREFEIPELKLLVDSVQTSKFLTERKSDVLIKKLESLCSKNQAGLLHRQVFVSNRIKNMNESIYITIDKIQTAIQMDLKIKFKYLKFAVGNDKVYKRNGDFYFISPYALMLGEQNYYLLGYDSKTDSFKHFRVDKIDVISLSSKSREGADEFKKINLSEYDKKFFSMFGGNVEKIKLSVDSDLMGVIVDRFGKDIIIMKTNEEYFEINVDIAVSPQFFGWVSSFSGKIRIVSPDNVVNLFKNHIENILNFYK